MRSQADLGRIHPSDNVVVVRTTYSVRSTYLLLLKPTVERRILYLLLMDTKISTVVFCCVTENSDDTFWKALGSIRDDLHSITLTSFLPLNVFELRKTPHGALCRCVFGSTDNVKNAKPSRLVKTATSCNRQMFNPTPGNCDETLRTVRCPLPWK